MGAVTGKAWTDYSEPRIMAADLEAIEAGIVDADLRLEGVEALAGLSPATPVDGQTANLIEQPGTLTNAALSAAIGESVEPILLVLDRGTLYPLIYLGGKRNGAEIADDIYGGVLLNPGSVGYNNVAGGDGTATVNTTTPNKSQPGTLANGSIVGGSDCVAGSLSSKIIGAHSYTEVGGPGHNAIYGGAGHVIRTAAGFAVIIGGSENDVGGTYALATGYQNKTDGQSSFIAGQNNVITDAGTGSAAVGGNHIVTSPYAYARGLMHDVNASYSEASGRKAKTTTPYERAHADGGFTGSGRTEIGSSQESRFIVKATTTSDASVTLGVGAGTLGPVMSPSTCWSFEAQVVAQDTETGDTAAWQAAGAIRRSAAGASTIVGTPTITQLGADASASGWALGVVASSIGHLNFFAKGSPGQTVRWVGTIAVAQVRMPGAV